MKKLSIEPEEPVVQNGDPVLRKITSIVATELIGGKTISAEIKHLQSVLRMEYDGVAIAGPQLGYSRRLFVISGRAMQEKPTDPLPEDIICINPKIVNKSSKTVMLDEGCLSVRYSYGSVKRHLQITLQYTDQNGVSQVRGASGFLAHIMQHEMDHLDGILFIDKAHNLEAIKGKDKMMLDQSRANYIEQIEKNGK